MKDFSLSGRASARAAAFIASLGGRGGVVVGRNLGSGDYGFGVKDYSNHGVDGSRIQVWGPFG